MHLYRKQMAFAVLLILAALPVGGPFPITVHATADTTIGDDDSGTLRKATDTAPLILDARDDTAFTFVNTPVDIDVLANDKETNVGFGPPFIIDIVTPPQNGAATVERNATPLDLTDDFIRYTPGTNVTGKDSLSYQIGSGGGSTQTGWVWIFVNTPAGPDLEVTVDVIFFPEDGNTITVAKESGTVTATAYVTVTNNGPGYATGVEVVNSLSDSATITGSSPSKGTFTPATGLWAVGDLAEGETATLSINMVTDDEETAIVHVVEVSSEQSDPDTSNNLDAVRIRRGRPGGAATPPRDLSRFQADLSLQKTVDDETPAPGGTVVYTLTLNNAGPAITAGVEVIDLLPEGVALVSATPSDPADSYDAATGLWDVGALRDGETVTLAIVAQVTGGGAITNVAELTRSNLPDPDSNTNNNQAGEDDQSSATITVQTAQEKTTEAEEEAAAPTTFALEANYPNPFNPETRLRFVLPETVPVRLTVYDVLGRQVRVLVDDALPAGRHETTFEAGDLPSGVYLARMVTPGGTSRAR